MYSIYFFDIDNIVTNILIYSVILLIALIFEFVDDLLDFKKFAKKYYYLDINAFRFSLILLKNKLKIM